MIAPLSQPLSGTVVRLAQAADPDRFFCALFTPAPARDAIMTLIAFNHEITRAVSNPLSAAVAGPMAGMIRLQWWREIVDGAPHPHDVATPLREAIAAGTLHAPTLHRLIEARECELDGVPDWQGWREMMLGSAGAIAEANLRALGGSDPAMIDAARAYGAAYGAGGLLRHLPAILTSGRYPLPDEALAEAGLSREAGSGGEVAAGAIEKLAAQLRHEGEGFLALGRSQPVPRRYWAAALPAALARRDLRRASVLQGARRGIGDKLAVIWSSIVAKA